MNTATGRFPIFLSLLILNGGLFAETLEGFYTSGHAVDEFAPCGERQIFRITADAELLEALRESYARLSTVAYEPVYVWLEGDRKRPSSDASGADHDAGFQLREVRLMRRRGPDDCIVPADPGGDDLEYLYSLIERTPRETALFDSQPLRARLESLLRDRMQTFLENMAVQGPLLRAGNMVYVEGTGRKAGDAAVLLVAPGADRLVAILVAEGHAQEFAENDKTIPFPPEVREFLEGVMAQP